jgi:hypothetical protein
VNRTDPKDAERKTVTFEGRPGGNVKNCMNGQFFVRIQILQSCAILLEIPRTSLRKGGFPDNDPRFSQVQRITNAQTVPIRAKSPYSRGITLENRREELFNSGCVEFEVSLRSFAKDCGQQSVTWRYLQ